jgi:hypothetical protein
MNPNGCDLARTLPENAGLTSLILAPSDFRYYRKPICLQELRSLHHVNHFWFGTCLTRIVSQHYSNYG